MIFTRLNESIDEHLLEYIEHNNLTEGWQDDPTGYLIDAMKYYNDLSTDIQNQISMADPGSKKEKYLMEQNHKLLGQLWWAYKKLGEQFDTKAFEDEYR